MNKYKLNIILLGLIGLYSMTYNSTVSSTNSINIVCSKVDIHNENWLEGNGISKEQALNAYSVSLIRSNYYNRIPIRATDFPNLKSIVFKEPNFINLNGIKEFKGLQSLEIINAYVDEKVPFNICEQLTLTDISEISEMQSLQTLHIHNIILLNYEAYIRPLQNLDTLILTVNYIPIDLIEYMPNLKYCALKNYYYSITDSIDLYISSKRFKENYTNISLPYSKNTSRNIMTELEVFDKNNYEHTHDFNGKYILRYPKTKKTAVTGWYRNGYRDSIWVYYDRKGNVIEKRLYSEGMLKKHLEKEIKESFDNSFDTIIDITQYLGGRNNKVITKYTFDKKSFVGEYVYKKSYWKSTENDTTILICNVGNMVYLNKINHFNGTHNACNYSFSYTNTYDCIEIMKYGTTKIQEMAHSFQNADSTFYYLPKLINNLK